MSRFHLFEIALKDTNVDQLTVAAFRPKVSRLETDVAGRFHRSIHAVCGRIGKWVRLRDPNNHTSLAANICKDTQSLLSPWTSTGLGNSSIAPGSTQVFTISIGEASKVVELAKSFRKAAVVFSLRSGSSPTLSAYPDLNELCDTNP